jgi:mevalonate kinase
MKFYSHGKLLISGEYLVLKGAISLAAPVNFGQTLEVKVSDDNSLLTWESYEYDKLWFKAQFHIPTLKIIYSSEPRTADRLGRILKATGQLNPGFFEKHGGVKIEVRTGFDLLWGLGSSSGLISNIALWAEVSPFALHKKVSQGSGYDVVCAQEDGPVFFKIQEESYDVQKVDFNPSFSDRIYFIYLGNKQNSDESVNEFYSRKVNVRNEIEIVSKLSQEIAFAENLYDFEKAVREHEKLLSSVLQQKKLKEERFSDLDGEVKSLGAWGGDFAMLTWHRSKQELIKYLESKKIQTVFTFQELVKIR